VVKHASSERRKRCGRTKTLCWHRTVWVCLCVHCMCGVAIYVPFVVLQPSVESSYQSAVEMRATLGLPGSESTNEPSGRGMGILLPAMAIEI